jgi:hypothetical protein
VEPRRPAPTIAIGKSLGETLFSTGWLSEWLGHRREKAFAVAAVLPAQTVLGGLHGADIFDEVFEGWCVDPPVLRIEDRYVREAEDFKFNAKRDFGPGIAAQSPPHYVAGTRIALHVPFDGTPEVFRYRPTASWSVEVRGTVTGRDVILTHDDRADRAPEAFASALEAQLRNLEQWTAAVRADCQAFNEDLGARLRVAVSNRIEKVHRDRLIESSLNVPVRRRTDPSPVLVPVVRKERRLPVVPHPSTAPATLEPTVLGEYFSDVLGVIQEWARSIERLPETFGPMGEEALRDNILVALNSQFGPASGEMFSRSGKTDILIQHEGGAVFIAECKFWTGPKGAGATLEQLLGYLVWRDTKSALILFVRNQNVTGVIAKVKGVIEAHPRFNGTSPSIGDAPVYLLHHQGDPERLIHVALVVVPVPSRTGQVPSED